MGHQNRHVFLEHCRKQGLPEGFDLPPFKIDAKIAAVGNGVPLAMGRAIARAVYDVLSTQSIEEAFHGSQKSLEAP